jgi:hypothetical protein
MDEQLQIKGFAILAKAAAPHQSTCVIYGTGAGSSAVRNFPA